MSTGPSITETMPQCPGVQEAAETAFVGQHWESRQESARKEHGDTALPFEPGNGFYCAVCI